MKLDPQGNILTSFPHAPAQITANHAVVTVISGSSKSGGHASIYLEWCSPVTERFAIPGVGRGNTTQGVYEMWLIDLGKGSDGITINWAITHRMNRGVIMDFLGKPDAWYLARHSHSYSATTVQARALWNASKRFAGKVADGRYAYVTPGGLVGVLATRPGKRGVNCADFVIKVLRESGIAHLRHKLWDTPLRVSS